MWQSMFDLIFIQSLKKYGGAFLFESKEEGKNQESIQSSTIPYKVIYSDIEPDRPNKR